MRDRSRNKMLRSGQIQDEIQHGASDTPASSMLLESLASSDDGSHKQSSEDSLEYNLQTMIRRKSQENLRRQYAHSKLQDTSMPYMSDIYSRTMQNLPFKTIKYARTQSHQAMLTVSRRIRQHLSPETSRVYDSDAIEQDANDAMEEDQNHKNDLAALKKLF